MRKIIHVTRYRACERHERELWKLVADARLRRRRRTRRELEHLLWTLRLLSR